MHKGPAHHTDTSWYLKNILCLHGNQVDSQTWFDATNNNNNNNNNNERS